MTSLTQLSFKFWSPEAPIQNLISAPTIYWSW